MKISGIYHWIDPSLLPEGLKNREEISPEEIVELSSSFDVAILHWRGQPLPYIALDELTKKFSRR